MAYKKISQMSDATTPLDGTEFLEVVQSGENKRVLVTNLGGGSAFTIGLSYESTQKPGDAAVIDIPRSAAAYTIPANLSGSYYDAATGPTAQAVVTLSKNGTSFATMTVAIGATSAVTLSGTEAVFAAGDQLSITFPTQDTTWAGVTLSINAVRS